MDGMDNLASLPALPQVEQRPPWKTKWSVLLSSGMQQKLHVTQQTVQQWWNVQYFASKRYSTWWAISSILLSRVLDTFIFPLSLYNSTPPELLWEKKENQPSTKLEKLFSSVIFLTFLPEETIPGQSWQLNRASPPLCRSGCSYWWQPVNQL